MSLNTRPKSVGDMIGVEIQKRKLFYMVHGAIARNKKLPNILISGPPGVGKTTLAHIIVEYSKSKYSNATLHEILGTNIKSPDNVYDLSTMCKDGDVIFIEECAHMGKAASTVLLPWMEEGKLIGAANMAAGVKAPDVSFVLATTGSGKLSSAIRSRCNEIHMDFYNTDEIKQILARAAKIDGFDISNDDAALEFLAQSCRGTPRIAIEKRLEPLLDIMSVDHKTFNIDTVLEFFITEGINEYGLDNHDIAYCNSLYKLQKEYSRPVSFKTMVQITGLEDNVVSNIIESYLLQIGAIKIESKGRILTKKGLKILNINETNDNIVEEVHSPEQIKSRSSLKISLDAEEIITMVQNGSFKTVKAIAERYNLPYVNPLVRSSIMNILHANGYTSRRKAGIVKLSQTQGD